MTACSQCNNRAVYSINGNPLCGYHYSNQFEDTVKKTINKYNMIPPGSRIAVGLSGGKDSTVLLSVLSKLDLDVELIAITIDEGIHGYRQSTIDSAKDLAKKIGIDHHIISFKDICGNTLDELLQVSPNQACSICGTLRRRALNKGCNDVNADRIATGHCLDDEAESILMNYLRGDITRVTRKFGTNASEKFKQRIKPLSMCYERQVVAYGIINKLLVDLPECPYTPFALRANVRNELNKLENHWSGTMLKIVEGHEKMIEKLGSYTDNIIQMGTCKNCGEPTLNTLCAACTQLNKRLNSINSQQSK